MLTWLAGVGRSKKYCSSTNTGCILFLAWLLIQCWVSWCCN